MVVGFRALCLWLWTFALRSSTGVARELHLEAVFNSQGVVGRIVFVEKWPRSANGSCSIVAFVGLSAFDSGDTGHYSWAVHPLPVDYSRQTAYGRHDICSRQLLGNKKLYDFDVLSNQTLHVPLLTSGATQIEFDIPLASGRNFGKFHSLWGHSILLSHKQSRRQLCSNIVPYTTDAHKHGLLVSEARFTSSVAGSVWLMYLHAPPSKDDEPDVYDRNIVKVFTTLFRSDGVSSRQKKYNWKLYSASERRVANIRDVCQVLQTEVKMSGQLDPISIPASENVFSRHHLEFSADDDLIADLFSSESTPYALYLAFEFENNIHACARIGPVGGVVAASQFSSHAMVGNVKFAQKTPFHTTSVEFENIDPSQSDVIIQTWPTVALPYTQEGGVALSPVGGLSPCSPFDTTLGPVSSSPDSPTTFDRISTGDLGLKYRSTVNTTLHTSHSSLSDPNINIYGRQSIIGRSVRLSKRNETVVICANILPFVSSKLLKELNVIASARARFTYPLVGDVHFVQYATGSSSSQVAVYSDGLLYSDSSLGESAALFSGVNIDEAKRSATTDGHEMVITQVQPGRDFYNWTGRCLSAGHIWDPIQVGSGGVNMTLNNECSRHVHDFAMASTKCPIGAISHRAGLPTLKAAVTVDHLPESRFLFTVRDLNLNDIIGRSLVLLDRQRQYIVGFQFRGPRLACTAVKRVSRQRAVANNWFSNSAGSVSIHGSIEFADDIHLAPARTHVKVQLAVPSSTSIKLDSLQLRQVSVQPYLQFPCTDQSLGHLFSPFNMSTFNNTGIRTMDQFAVGNLGSKHLDAALEQSPAMRPALRYTVIDSNSPMFGSKMSLLGRSVAISADSSTSCASIGWSFGKSSSSSPAGSASRGRQVSYIASFHNPSGFVWGYVRFRQVIYDGRHDSVVPSPTIIEVRLKYVDAQTCRSSHASVATCSRFPNNDNRLTLDHDWSIYVAPVGHDATISHLQSRCSAAGYRWNPNLANHANPLDKTFYKSQCGTGSSAGRCEVGDMSGKHGPIQIGGQAYVFSDSHLDLDTSPPDRARSINGRSIVIHGAGRKSGERLSCASVQPDDDIVRSVTVEAVSSMGGSSRFNVAEFMGHVRSLLTAPEWFIFADVRATTILVGNRCVRLKVHFTGPHAHYLDSQFELMTRRGSVGPHAGLQIAGFSKDANHPTVFKYKLCSHFDDDDGQVRSDGGGRIKRLIPYDIQRQIAGGSSNSLAFGYYNSVLFSIFFNCFLFFR